MTAHYDYHRPTSLADAWQLFADTPGARYIAGGTDLMVQLRRRPGREASALISLRNIAELGHIWPGDRFRIGAGASLTDIIAHPGVREVFPALVQSIDVVGSRQIRNVATLAGNLCNASPAADTAPALLVYDARVELRSPDGTRELPLGELFLGPGKTALAPGEIMTAVLLDPPARGVRSTFARKGRVKMDLAIVSVAVALELDGVTCTAARVAVGAVAPTPLRVPDVEAALVGSVLDADTIARACERVRAGIAPIDDLRSSAEYRRDLTCVLLGRALRGLASKGQS